MKKFIIERTLPGAGSLSEEELQEIAKASVTVMTVMGKPYKWVHSYVTEDKIFCVHEAEDPEVVRQHSNCANFPVDTILEVKGMISPATARGES